MARAKSGSGGDRQEPAAAGGARVGLLSLGCPKNLVDSERMLGQIAEKHVVVSDLEDAEVVVVNTCAFVEDAKQESIDAILEMLERKRQGKLERVVVTGCLAQRYAEELGRELPGVDAIVGVTSESAVAPLIDAFRAEGPRKPLPKKLRMAPKLVEDSGTPARDAKGLPAAGPRVIVADPTRPFEAETGRLRLTPRHYAYLRVAEGCDHACTFCAIPGFRGRFRSKPEDAILTEARELAADGARELLLIAEDTNQYGMDRQDGASLARLLERLAGVDGVRWLRLLYAYPAYFPDALIDAIAHLEQVVKYIDIPLQHIADPVLKRMRRPPRAKTEELLGKLRERIPGLTLRTTMICGFPGETERDHQDLVEFVRGFGFDRLGAFAYSEEDGTDAASFADQLPEEVRVQRRDEVMAAQQEVAFRRNEALRGRVVRCIVDRVEAAGRALGRTEGDAPDIDGTIRLYEKGRVFEPGEVLRARVKSAKGYDLEGAPVDDDDDEGGADGLTAGARGAAGARLGARGRGASVGGGGAG